MQKYEEEEREIKVCVNNNQLCLRRPPWMAHRNHLDQNKGETFNGFCVLPGVVSCSRKTSF